ncbi:hypothetical protein PCASD_01449 [Puccinia coronata f. sp. avenae]|uniref:Uncharacterized protein n=1 Tax=Puccinia coronata f. sp. avenae TaxID=200324 RepID=A0A2N5VKT9_9BASI|nr:hypothetical protein PCASD_21794 [Puccinia coronata f. sp. avenae]PLW50566.1 hypothetical protein PCASD_01449 [Puccinia coronata f. sp. avenae]
MPRQVLRGAVQAPVSIDQAEYVQLAGAYRFAKMRALVVLPAGQSPSLVHLAFENSLYRTYSPLHGNQPRSDRGVQHLGLTCQVIAEVSNTSVLALLWEFHKNDTAGINRSNTAVQAVLEQPCLTGGRTGTVRPKHLPAGRTGLSNQFLGPVAQDQPGPVGQICPTSWLSLWSDSAHPTTSQTWLFEHRSNCRV